MDSFTASENAYKNGFIAGVTWTKNQIRDMDFLDGASVVTANKILKELENCENAYRNTGTFEGRIFSGK